MAKDIKENEECKEWLGGEYSDFISGDGTGSNKRETAKDKVGARVQCRNYFPTRNEREKLERTSTDPFDLNYHIVRQYCWARNLFKKQDPCFKWKQATTESVSSEDLEKDCQLVTIVKFFNKAKVCLFRTGEEYLHGGVNTSKRPRVCAYYQSWAGVLIGKTKYIDNLIGCVDTPMNPAPHVFNPAIPAKIVPFVDIKLGTQALIKQFGSTFDQPTIVIRFTSFDLQSSHATDDLLVLRYRFAGDNYVYDSANIAFANAPRCGQLPSYPVEYCAIVPPDSPEKICVCESNKCAPNGTITDCTPSAANNCTCNPNHCLGLNLGCVSRPTPKDSNVAVVGKVTSATDNSGTSSVEYPAFELIIARTNSSNEPIQVDSQGNKVYEKDEEFFQLTAGGAQTDELAVPPVDFVRLPLSQTLPPIKIKEYFLDSVNQSIVHDSGSIYGIDFETIIPKMNTNKEIVELPSTILMSAEHNLMSTVEDRGGVCPECGCAVCSRETNLDAESIILAGGIRDMTACCPRKAMEDVAKEDNISLEDAMNEMCKVPPYNTKCSGYRLADPAYLYRGKNAPPRDEEAEKLACPGIYQGLSPTDPNNGSHICVISHSSWQEAFPDPYCVKLPIKGCDPITTPSAESGNTTWSKPLKDGESETGTCPGGAFSEEITVNIQCPVCDHGQQVDPMQQIEAQMQLQDVTAIVDKEKSDAARENRKININTINAEIAKQGYQINYVTLNVTTLYPVRTCILGDTYKVDNPCMAQEATGDPGNTALPDIGDNDGSISGSNPDGVIDGNINAPLPDKDNGLGSSAGTNPLIPTGPGNPPIP